jgi:hypothetical protein
MGGTPEPDEARKAGGELAGSSRTPVVPGEDTGAVVSAPGPPKVGRLSSTDATLAFDRSFTRVLTVAAPVGNEASRGTPRDPHAGRCGSAAFKRMRAGSVGSHLNGFVGSRERAQHAVRNRLEVSTLLLEAMRQPLALSPSVTYARPI